MFKRLLGFPGWRKNVQNGTSDPGSGGDPSTSNTSTSSSSSPDLVSVLANEGATPASPGREPELVSDSPDEPGQRQSQALQDDVIGDLAALAELVALLEGCDEQTLRAKVTKRLGQLDLVLGAPRPGAQAAEDSAQPAPVQQPQPEAAEETPNSASEEPAPAPEPAPTPEPVPAPGMSAEEEAEIRAEVQHLGEELKQATRTAELERTASLDQSQAQREVIDDLERKLRSREELEVELQEQRDDLRTKLDGVQTEVDGLRTKLDGVQTEADGLRTKLDGVQTEADGLRKELDTARKTIATLEGKAVRGAKELRQTSDALDSTRTELESRVDELTQESAARDRAVGRLASLDSVIGTLMHWPSTPSESEGLEGALERHEDAQRRLLEVCSWRQEEMSEVRRILDNRMWRLSSELSRRVQAWSDVPGAIPETGDELSPATDISPATGEGEPS